MKISEIITDKYKLRIPPTVYYELLADIRNFEEPTTKDDAPENNVENIEPTTKNDLAIDCIDRNSIKYYSGHGGYMYASKGEIDKLPSVTPQERKGHWNDIPKYKDIAWQCSECKRFTTMKHNYCPLCGAKMVEPQESDIEKRKPCINKEKKVMNNKTNDLLWVWIISTALLFPLKENGELKMTKNEENNLNMLMKEIGEVVEDE